VAPSHTVLRGPQSWALHGLHAVALSIGRTRREDAAACADWRGGSTNYSANQAVSVRLLTGRLQADGSWPSQRPPEKLAVITSDLCISLNEGLGLDGGARVVACPSPRARGFANGSIWVCEDW
jgi:hypothetical protein